MKRQVADLNHELFCGHCGHKIEMVTISLQHWNKIIGQRTKGGKC